MTKILSGILLFLLLGCHPRPIDEMALADLAMKAAVKAKADALAPDAFRKAENYFLRAKKDYAEGYFESAKKHASEARLLAEQAEFKSLQKQSQIRNKTLEEESGLGVGSVPPEPPMPPPASYGQ